MSTEGHGAVAIVPEGFQFPPGKDSATVLAASVDEDYFDAMGLTILRGRAFRRTDSAGAPGVAVINEQLARHYWPDQDPIGKRFRINDAQGAWMQIVGLAKTSNNTFLAEKPMEFLYFCTVSGQCRA